MARDRLVCARGSNLVGVSLSDSEGAPGEPSVLYKGSGVIISPCIVRLPLSSVV